MRDLSRRLLAALLACSLAACGGSPPRPRPNGNTEPTPKDPKIDEDARPAPTYRTLDADTAVTTGWGATTSVPAGWHLSEEPDLVLVQDPEREVRIALLALDGGDSLGAIGRAWDRVEPGFDLAVAQDDTVPADGGWDEIRQLTYVTPAEESRVVIALVRRTGETFHVALLEGTTAAFGRRGAQIGSIALDLKVPGVERETLVGHTPALDADRLATLDAFIEEARAQVGVPGVAVAVVHGGKIVFETGHGVKQIGSKAKPEANAIAPSTLFMIGSITKSITTLLIAKLVDEGKLRWDQPVTDVLPSFALGDPEITKLATMRHTACACTGMPRQDLEMVFEFGGWTAEQRLATMSTMVPTTKLGETFQYSNLMVAAGGFAAAHAYAPKAKLGAAYVKAMKALVFDPVGMKTATLDRKAALKGDAARPHARSLGAEAAAIPVEHEAFVDPVAPAGAVWASVRDMATYMMLELARGKNGKGKQVVSEASLLERRQPQIAISEHEAYGLGLVVGDVYGLPMLTHNGGTAGFNTEMLILPEQDLGVVILTNNNQSGRLISAIERRFFELVLGAEERAATDLAEGLALRDRTLQDELAMIAAPDDAWVEPLLGKYTEAGLGAIELRRDGERVVLDAGEWQSAIGKKTGKDGTIVVVTTEGAFAGLELIPRVTDGQQTLVIDDGQQVYTFVP